MMTMPAGNGATSTSSTSTAPRRRTANSRRVVSNVRILLAIAVAILSLGPFSIILLRRQPAVVVSVIQQTDGLGNSMFPPTKSSRRSENNGVIGRAFYDDVWQESTIVATIAFGNATRTHLVERLVHSLQTNGGWRAGRIVILTDDPQRYRNTFLLEETSSLSSSSLSDQGVFPSNNRIIILEATPEDLLPRKGNRETALFQFKRDAMRYKRFKTLVLDYLDVYYQDSGRNEESRRDRFVVYMDVDVVVARPLTALLQDFQDQMIRKGVFTSPFSDSPQLEEEDKKGGNNATRPATASTSHYVDDSSTSSLQEESSSSALPFLAMFTDCPTCARHNTNSGVIILHRQRSRPCLREWNDLFLQNADWGVYDQRYLRDIRANGKCKIYTLPDYHRLYPTWKDMRLLLSATIVHNTNSYNAKKVPGHVQVKYFAHLLAKGVGGITQNIPGHTSEVELF